MIRFLFFASLWLILASIITIIGLGFAGLVFLAVVEYV